MDFVQFYNQKPIMELAIHERGMGSFEGEQDHGEKWKKQKNVLDIMSIL